MNILQTDGLDASRASMRPLIRSKPRRVRRAVRPPGSDAGKPGPDSAAAAVLLSWDGRTDPDSPPTLYQSLLTSLMRRLLSDEMSPATLSFLQFYFNSIRCFSRCSRSVESGHGRTEGSGTGRPRRRSWQTLSG